MIKSSFILFPVVVLMKHGTVRLNILSCTDLIGERPAKREYHAVDSNLNVLLSGIQAVICEHLFYGPSTRSLPSTHNHPRIPLQPVYESILFVSVSCAAVPLFHDVLVAHLGEHSLLSTVHIRQREAITEVTNESHNHYPQCNEEGDSIAWRKLFAIRLSTDYSGDISEPVDTEDERSLAGLYTSVSIAWS